jgi:glycosidase
MIEKTIFGTLVASLLATSAFAQNYRDRLPEDEVIYFLLPDRFENGDTRNDKGGLKGGPLQTGFDPARKGFYHGGDLKGLINRLDYIQAMGATAIWLSPIFKNKPVQGGLGQETAGYHGYWVTDFTAVDPHLGTEADFRALVDAAHSRGMKVYMDIITNHTADVISYKECPDGCEYRSRADYPYSRRSSDAAAINPGFAGDNVQAPENFAKLTDPNYAYTVIVPKAEAKLKAPAWLNDPLLYHNRGNSTFGGESSTMGDFSGLDDVMTENPRVVAGFIDVYGNWIDRFGIDGYRIDTAKHVNPEFWAAFAPAMLARAKAKGIPNFHIFGEVATGELDPALTATATRVAKLPTVLDFAFRNALQHTLAGSAGTFQLEKLFAADALYEGGEETARRLPTFTSNHDVGRFAHFAREAFPQASDAEILKRVKLAHAMLFGLRGVPVVYAGDEQGFAGDGGDQDAREDMFPSKVAVYNDNRLIGTNATTAESNFDRGHPLYKQIATLSALRRDYPALRRGKQVVRAYGDKPGLFAVSRIDPQSGREIVIAFNTSNAALSANVEVASDSSNFNSLLGVCPTTARAPGTIAVSLPALDFMICEAAPKE